MTPGSRTIQIVVNDGTSSSPAVTSTVAVTSSSTQLAITPDQSVINAAAASSIGFTFSGSHGGRHVQLHDHFQRRRNPGNQ